MTVPDTEHPGLYDPPGGTAPRTGMENVVRWSLIGLMLLMVVGLSFGLGFGTRLLLNDSTDTPTGTRATTRADGAPDFRVLDDIYKTLKDHYVDPDRIEPDLMRTGAINGLINAVGDTHQVYITKENSEFEDDNLNGQFEGIGAYVDQKGGEIVITQPFADSPAKAAGIRPGDVILMINGESTKGFSVRDAQRRIRGQAGSTVKIQVRHGDGKVEELSVTRDKIQVASVRPDKAQDAQGNVVEDIAYVRIEQFTQRTPAELSQYLQSIQGKGYKGLILDMRNNPGGLVSSVQRVGEQFMKNQTVLIEQHRGGREERIVTGDRGIATDMKLAVLVNRNSASGSEVLAGALRDNKGATVLGETTFGKGTVNTFYDLPSDGGKLYVTIARWLTPKRDLIEGKGVKPDIEIKIGDEESPDVREYFNSVMFRAVDLLRGQTSEKR